jgi:hypothetical protein
VSVEGDELGLGAGVDEQRFGVARILGGDDRHALQRVGGSRREVAEIAERRRDDIEGACHVTT